MKLLTHESKTFIEERCGLILEILKELSVDNPIHVQCLLGRLYRICHRMWLSL